MDYEDRLRQARSSTGTRDANGPSAAGDQPHADRADTVKPQDAEPSVAGPAASSREVPEQVAAEGLSGSDRHARGPDDSGDRHSEAVTVPQDALPERMEIIRYEGKPMVDAFKYETDPHHRDNPFPGRAVERLTPDERENHRIYFDESGLLRASRDGDLFDTRGAQTHWSGTGDRAIFIMDSQGNLYASKYQAVGRFHHSTLANGEPVAAADEMRVVDGQFLEVTAASGHNRPTTRHMAQLAAELARNSVQDVPIHDFDGRTRLSEEWH